MTTGLDASTCCMRSRTCASVAEVCASWRVCSRIPLQRRRLNAAKPTLTAASTTASSSSCSDSWARDRAEKASKRSARVPAR